MATFNIDEAMRIAALNTPQSTPEQLPSDDLSSQRNFFENTVASFSYHDEQARRKFKDLEFAALVLKVREIKTREELELRTSKIFTNYIWDPQSGGTEVSFRNETKSEQPMWEIFAHIPEISGLLPQPSFRELLLFHDHEYESSIIDAGTEEGKKQLKFQKKKFNILVSRYPKFYCISNVEPQGLDIWKIKFHDENFLYYGRALSKLSAASVIKANFSKEVMNNFASQNVDSKAKKLIEGNNLAIVGGLGQV